MPHHLGYDMGVCMVISSDSIHFSHVERAVVPGYAVGVVLAGQQDDGAL